MIRARSGLVVGALIAAMSFSSCTCHEGSPPEGTAPQNLVEKRPPGFTLGPRVTHTPLPATPWPSPKRASPNPSPKGTTTPQPNVALPTDFPSDVPVMPGATLSAVQQLGGGAHNVLFTTSQSPSQIFDYYKNDLKAAGHKVTQEYQASDQSFISFKKGNLVTNIVIAPDPNDSTHRVIAIMYQEEQDVDEF